MAGMASPEKASSSKKKGERKCASKEEYRQLSSIMGVMNNLRKQVCKGGGKPVQLHVNVAVMCACMW